MLRNDGGLVHCPRREGGKREARGITASEWDLVHAAPNLQVPARKWVHTERKEAMMMVVLVSGCS